MRTTKRKRKKQNRKEYDYEGEKVVFWLLLLLNNRPAGSDVHKIVRGLKRLDGIAMKLNWTRHQLEETGKWRRFKRLGEIIGKRLARYATRPAIATNELAADLRASKYTPGVPVEFQKVHDTYGAFAWVRQPNAPIALEEAFAVTALETVVNSGWLWKLRVCENCKRWFWARKNNQLFCSNSASGGTRCRQKLWDSSPVNVERRRQRRTERRSLFK